MRALSRFVCAAIAALLCTSISAHHGYAGYDRCKRFTITGEIERISWSNPHVVFTLKPDDSRSYLVQWFAPQRLLRFGLSSDTLRVGDRIEVTGSRNLDPAVRIITLITAVRRPADGWAWSRPVPPPDSCGG